jgi:hypothetical protein
MCVITKINGMTYILPNNKFIRKRNNYLNRLFFQILCHNF